MTHNSAGPMPGSRTPQRPTWWAVVFFLAVLAVSWWQTRTPLPNPPEPAGTSRSTASSNEHEVEPANRSIPVDVADEADSEKPKIHSATRTIRPEEGSEQSSGSDRHAAPASPIVQIKNQRIRDQDGKIIYSGTIDLQPTLDRIARGDSNSHRNDGTTFQNRERRLPVKPTGYYKEYVHPTPKVSGPGPQRIIIGKDDDIWYTPDHYRTFQRIQ